MKATMLLKRDHSTVTALFEEFAAATSPGTREQIVARIRTELEVHMQIEEELFYPECKKIPECADLIKEAIQEHKMVKQLLAEVGRMGADDDDYVDRVEALRENFDHHVEEEEGEIFPLAKKALSDDRLEDIGRRIEERKQTVGVKVRKQLAPA